MNDFSNYPTQLLYSNGNSTSAELCRLIRLERIGEKQVEIVFDKTTFFPQGGGQPSDKGMVKFGATVGEVLKVRLNERGQAVHTCLFENGIYPEVGSEAVQEIDWALRMLNSRSHTAGHLIDLAVQQSVFKREPLKANHAIGDSWVQFHGDSLPDGYTTELVCVEIQAEVAKLIAEDHPVTAEVITVEAASAFCVASPNGSSPRVVSIGKPALIARGCGGTHVSSLGEIGAITITGVRCRKGVLSITYRVS
jgi:Ser-tRNA(Ala) deacylase AlaX